MKKPSIIENENGRLSALRQSRLLESIREDSFDAITMITAQTCDMPIALICLIDEKRIWIKSQQGIDGVIEIPRDIGFCSHTITQDKVLEIKNASLDDRFSDNPMVTENQFKYYAGAPLITPDGFALGTICVMDIKPRSLSDDHKDFLKRMAFAVSGLIQARINSNSKQLTHNSSCSPKSSKKEQAKTHFSIQDNHINYPKVFIIDNDKTTTTRLYNLLAKNSMSTEIFSSTDQFLNFYNGQHGCLICEAKFYKQSDLTLQEQCKQQDIHIPIMFISEHVDLSTCVSAIKSGAIDFLEKPLNEQVLLQRIQESINLDAAYRQNKKQHDAIINRFSTLTTREMQVLRLLVSNRAKLANKDIAEQLKISRRTVEVHRSSIMSKMLASSRLELLEIAEVCGLRAIDD